jgi:hypothetical protein
VDAAVNDDNPKPLAGSRTKVVDAEKARRNAHASILCRRLA